MSDTAKDKTQPIEKSKSSGASGLNAAMKKVGRNPARANNQKGK